MKIPVRVSISLDPALTDKKRSDFSAFIVNMVDMHDKWWIYEAEAFKGKPSEVVERFVLYAVRYRPAAISIETTAAQMLYKELLVPRLREAGIHTNITEYRPSTQIITKIHRVEALQPRFKQGKIAFRRVACKELIRQLDEFPENDHDDLLDSLVQQGSIARPPQLYELLGSTLDEEHFDEEADEGGVSAYANVGYGTPRR